MPWWSWILIWIALIALSLSFYALLGIRLFRQFMATMKDLAEAGERLGTFSDEQGVEGTAVTRRQAGEPVPGEAIFASRVQSLQDYQSAKAERQAARRDRRVARRRDRNQLQSLSDIGL